MHIYNKPIEKIYKIIKKKEEAYFVVRNIDSDLTLNWVLSILAIKTKSRSTKCSITFFP